MPEKLTSKKFIKKAKLVHGDKYSYNKSIYINGKSNVIIICRNCHEHIHRRKIKRENKS